MVGKIIFAIGDNNIYIIIARGLSIIALSLSILYICILAEMVKTDSLNNFYDELIWISAFGAVCVFFLCSITCRYIATSQNSEKAKAYKMAAACLDFVYVSMGFIGAVCGLAQLTSTGFQNFVDTKVLANEKNIEDNHRKFISAMGIIESYCFNVTTQALRDICTETKQYENLLTTINMNYIFLQNSGNIFDATSICNKIKSSESSPFLQESKIVNFCRAPTFTMEKDKLQKIVDYKYKKNNGKFLSATKLWWTFFLLFGFSARFSKAILDLWFNRYRKSKLPRE